MDVKNMCHGRQQQIANMRENNSEIEANIKVVAKNSEIMDKSISSNKEENKEVEKSVDKLNKLLEPKDIHLEYEIYGKFRDLTIRLVDNNTKEIIKEIPPKKIIDMVDKLCELAGILIDQKA
ncbi:flagellar protein FlaG [Clostridium niameyense]|uniref:Flagellar protein FlaG n=1 Tax=Clostridium niameyense TaxID=1622073 RepID=A0A6M0R6P4_9CLOT|nr:flagellar protein FlaG [Clostridium niameyense]NEZ45866.1 flagellar protein FlaG [Clostridium niameyense]